MVILFRPYLPELTTPKSYDSSGPESEISSDEATLSCRWIGCNRSFENLDMLSNHVAKEHANPGKGGIFFCGWDNCNRGDKGFNARYKMLVHVRTHTNEKPHHCYQCNKSFSRAENLKIHSRSHTGEKPYACTFPGCDKAYSNSSDRFKHSRTHAVDKPYACKIPGCPKRYTDPSSLRKHVKTYKHFPTANSALLEEPPKEYQISQNTNDRVRFPDDADEPVTTKTPETRKSELGERISDETCTAAIIPYLQSRHVNEIYLWQSARALQMYDTPLPLVSGGANKYSEPDQPLDLRIHCD